MSNNNNHAKTYYANTIETDDNIKIISEGYYYTDFPSAGEETKIIKDKDNNIINTNDNKLNKKLCSNCGYYYTNNDLCPACHQHQIKNRKLIK